MVATRMPPASREGTDTDEQSLQESRVELAPTMETTPVMLSLEEILEPLAHLRLGRNTETDENYGDNNEPDEETERSLDDGNQK